MGLNTPQTQDESVRSEALSLIKLSQYWSIGCAFVKKYVTCNSKDTYWRVLGRRRRRHPSLDDFYLTLRGRRLHPQDPPDRPRALTRRRPIQSPSLPTRQDEGLVEDHRTSHSLSTGRGPCTVRPTKLGPAWACVSWAVSVIKYTVMTGCNLPSWEYSGDKPGTRGSKCLWQGQATPQVPINTPVLCRSTGRLTWLLISRVSIANSFPKFPLDQPVLEDRCQQRAIVLWCQWDWVKKTPTPICFVILCFTRSFAICMAPVLSQRRGVGV